MKIAQCKTQTVDDLSNQLESLKAIEPQWVLVFAAPTFFANPALALQLAEAFPHASRVGCSTAGEISVAGVSDGTCTITAIHFEHTQLIEATTELLSMEDSNAAGQRLAAQLKVGPRGEPPAAVFVLGQGVAINGSALGAGLNAVLGAEVPITGGLAGDGADFNQTWVLDSQGVSNNRAVALGLYGKELHFGFGSYGGWQAFGPARKVTRSVGNVLYELDGEPALEIYKRYLGAYAKDLPASGLLFPFLMMNADQADSGLIRTILSVDEASNSLVLAGEIHADGYLKLMHSNPDALVLGAETAAKVALSMMHREPVTLALLVSCVGRKLTMGDLVDEEVEVIADLLGENTALTGFYSYGEICPSAPSEVCKLHNQTMTISFLSES